VPVVIVDPEVYACGAPTHVILRASKQLEKDMLPPHGAKKTCQKVVEWDDHRIALICQWKEFKTEDGKKDYEVHITKFREAGKP